MLTDENVCKEQWDTLLRGRVACTLHLA